MIAHRIVMPPLHQRLMQQAKQLLFAAGLFLQMFMLMLHRDGQSNPRSVAAQRIEAMSSTTHVAVIHTNDSTPGITKENH